MKTIGKWCDVLWNWTVYSSANPGKISSTIKFALTAAGTLLTVSLGFGHIAFPSDLWTQVSDVAIQLAQSVILAITSVGTLVALLRKIYMTILGEHANIQQG